VIKKMAKNHPYLMDEKEKREKYKQG